MTETAELRKQLNPGGFIYHLHVQMKDICGYLYVFTCVK